MSLNITLMLTVCPQCERKEYVYSTSVTHNLRRMAKELGIYDCLWHSELTGIMYAGELVPRLEKAINAMRAEPDRFRAFDSPDGDGIFAEFLPWLSELLEACKEHPNAAVHASR